MTATLDLRAALRLRQRASQLEILRGLAGALIVCEILGQSGALPSLVGGGLANLLRLPFFAPALLGAFACQLLLRPRRHELAASAAVAAAFAWPFHSAIAGDAHALLTTLLAALGTGAIAVLAVQAWRARDEERDDALDALLPAAILPSFVVLAQPMVYLTAALWPTTCDHRLYLVDAAFGAPLSFAVGQLVAAIPLLADTCLAVYVALPLALMIVHALRVRQGEHSSDALATFVALTVIGYFGYMTAPVAGPVYAFAPHFPAEPPDPATLSAARSLVLPMPRNCMPSLHSGWALLVWWNARPLAPWARGSATVFLAITLLATVGLGFHYVVDLVAAFPLTMAVQAWATRTGDEALRRRAITSGAAMTIAWMALVTWHDGVAAWPAPLLWTLAIGVVGASSWLERRAYAARIQPPSVAASRALPASWSERAPAVAMLLCGFAGFLHWTIYANALGVAFAAPGAIRRGLCVAVVAGAAAGLVAGGRLMERGLRPMRTAVAGCAALAVASMLAPFVLAWTTETYLAAAATRASDDGALFAVRAVLAALLSTPASVLTGLVIAACAESRRVRRGSAVGLPLGFLLLGAATGAIASAYLVLPSLYSRHLPTAVAAVAALAGLAAWKRDEPGGAAAAFESHVTRWTAIAGAAVVGLLAGVILAPDAYLLAVVLGDTVQSRAQVPAMACLGLGAGALLAGKLLREGVDARFALALTLSVLALNIALLGALWNDVPGYFATFGEYGRLYQSATTVAERELVRLCACAPLILAPALLLGAAIPLVAAAGDPGCTTRTWSDVPAVAALGGLGGACVATFALIPGPGSGWTLEMAAWAVVFLSTALLAGLPADRRRTAAVATALAAGALLFAPRAFDFEKLASGSGLSFEPGSHGAIAAVAESAAGLVTVHDGGEDVRRLAVGGLVLDASLRSRPPDLRELAALPLVRGRERALVVGAGAGLSARLLRDAGFARIVVAEANPAVVAAARTQFRDVNDGVLDDARTVVRATGGRGVLRLEDQAYDLISLDNPEISSPDAASLFTREAYSLAAARLAPRGALQQKLDLSRLSALGLASAVGSARRSFDLVWIFFAGDEAVLVACTGACDAVALQRPAGRQDAVLAGLASRTGLDPEAPGASGWLDPSAVDRMLEAAAGHLGVAVEALGSADPDMFLAHHAIRSFVRAPGSPPDCLGMLTEFAIVPDPKNPPAAGQESGAEGSGTDGDRPGASPSTSRSGSTP